METLKELIETLQKYPPEAKVALHGGHLIEVDAINPQGPHCCVWIQPLGSRVMAEIAFEEKCQPPEDTEGDEWKSS